MTRGIALRAFEDYDAFLGGVFIFITIDQCLLNHLSA